MTTQKTIYLNRINLALDYINQNLDKKISIQDLAFEAHFSSFHFHRIFQTIMNESVGNYVNRIKLEKAAQLLNYTDKTILDVSLDLGFSSAATFSRAFKNHFESTPSYYRKNGLTKNSKICKETIFKGEYICTSNEKQKIVIKELEFKKIAFISISDSFKEGKVLKSLSYLVDWSKKMGIFNEGEVLGMSLDDIMVTPKNKYRYLVGITTPDNFTFEHSIIKMMSIPKSKYATSKVFGAIDKVINSWGYLYNNWLTSSNYEPNHLYAFEKFLNKEKINDWSNFDLELALPIKHLCKY